MAASSDRPHDAFANPAKMAFREGNLRVLREAAFLLWEDGDRTRLRCDWCEPQRGGRFLLIQELVQRGLDFFGEFALFWKRPFPRNRNSTPGRRTSKPR